MEEDEFHSLNKGVFVIPFKPSDSEPGPSRRPLSKVYDLACAKLDEAYENHESERTSEQLDEIADWLDRCAAPPLLRQSFPTRRLPVALMQGVSPGVADQLSTLPATVATINGREVQDLASATRAVAVGFLGDVALEAKKAGRTPLDEVERWASKKKHSALLIFIEEAQIISLSVLSELIYILTLHHTVPFRLLISVPAIRTFISSWTLLEPSEVDLSILISGRARKRGVAVDAILDVAQDPAKTPFPITDVVADELRSEEALIGGGAAGALRSLKWLLLRHSMSSPLAGLDADGEGLSPEQLGRLQSLAEQVQEGEPGPSSELFTVANTDDLSAAQNPAPRMSILAAMAKTATFLPKADSRSANGPSSQQAMDIDEPESESEADATPSGTPRKDNGSRNVASEQGDDDPGQQHPSDGEDSFLPLLGTRSDAIITPFQELEAMHALWQSSGKSVSLWDWLEGFRHAMAGDSDEKEGDNGVENPEADATGKRKRGVELDEDEEARLHARFIRFVEESRMMGLVRVRGGKGAKRGDEVVKGVLMI